MPTPLDHLRKLAAAHAETGAPASYVVKMRNVAAADTARAIQAYFAEKGVRCTVHAEPVTNTLIASGEPVHVRRALDLAAALDVAPPQVAVSGLVLTVSREFLETAGLSTEKNETAWSLSVRETHMLTWLIRAAKANDKNFETLSRPQIQVCDKQTGFVRVGQDVVVASATGTKIEGTTAIAVEAARRWRARRLAGVSRAAFPRRRCEADGLS
jgi:type II secretory pathway component GspD/PulD (secretin)